MPQAMSVRQLILNVLRRIRWSRTPSAPILLFAKETNVYFIARDSDPSHILGAWRMAFLILFLIQDLALKGMTHLESRMLTFECGVVPYRASGTRIMC